MVLEGLQSDDYEVEPQEFEKVERNGFSVVEWGGVSLN